MQSRRILSAPKENLHSVFQKRTSIKVVLQHLHRIIMIANNRRSVVNFYFSYYILNTVDDSQTLDVLITVTSLDQSLTNFCAFALS